MADFQIVIAGFGGQGLLFSGKVLAYAGLLEGRELSWLPSYGPEMRGGTANCNVILSDTPVGSPIVQHPNVLCDEFTDDDEVYTFTVRTSSIDIGRHMNNVAYVRAFLDCFTADEVASMPVKTMEARYITACMEGEELKIFKKRTDTGFVLGARRADGKCAAFLGITLKE